MQHTSAAQWLSFHLSLTGFRLQTEAGTSLRKYGTVSNNGSQNSHFFQMCKMGVTRLHDSHARVLAVPITLPSRVYLLRTVLSYMILMAVP